LFFSQNKNSFRYYIRLADILQKSYNLDGKKNILKRHQSPISRAEKEEDMSRSPYWLLALMALIGGMIGGFISTQFFSRNEVAFAQNGTYQVKQKQIYATTIIAEEFFLHSKKEYNPLDGQIPIPRALLTTEPDGNPKLIMQDKDGNPRLSIQLKENDGATLAMLGEEGEQRLVLSEKGSYGETRTGSTVALLDTDGKIRAQMGLQADSNPFVSLSDPPPEEKSSCRNIKLCLKEKDKASITLSGVEGILRAGLQIDSGNTCFSLNDLKGKTRAELGNTKLAFGSDGFLKKTSSAFSVEKRSPSSLVLYNENGDVLWSAP